MHGRKECEVCSAIVHKKADAGHVPLRMEGNSLAGQKILYVMRYMNSYWVLASNGMDAVSIH